LSKEQLYKASNIKTYNSFELKLPTRGEPLVRRIEKDTQYKIIYSYKRDDLLSRGKYGAGTETDGQLEIIDIVPVDARFERQYKHIVH
jgi:hypothetical protein